MIEDIINKEWQFFQEVHHIDGYASCQEDFSTFYIMRASQFEVWNQELLTSYLEDLKLYEKKHINPIYQKYGIMMASNDPVAYQEIKDTLLSIPKDKQQIIEEIIRIQLRWKEAFNDSYPKLAKQSRLIYSNQDTKEETSFETYLRGELSTYLDQTLYLYGKMILSYLQSNQNITTLIMENTVKHYQYDSLQQYIQSIE